MPAMAAAPIAACPRRSRTETAIFTRAGVTRIMRFAFALARTRPRRLLTVVTKSNAQRHGMVMWDEIAAEISARISGCRLGQDAGRCHDRTHGPQARQPSIPSWRPISTPTSCRDLAAALAGIARASRPRQTSIREQRFPSMFEPIHGSAFDITGKGIANPIADASGPRR